MNTITAKEINYIAEALKWLSNVHAKAAEMKHDGEEHVGWIVSTRYLRPTPSCGIHAVYTSEAAGDDVFMERGTRTAPVDLVPGTFEEVTRTLSQVVWEDGSQKWIVDDCDSGCDRLHVLECGDVVVSLADDPVLPMEWKSLGKHPDGCTTALML